MKYYICNNLLHNEYMHNITLISTIHSERGKCNSDELYKIIESISPEVIFEELTNDLFDIIYNSRENQLDDEPLEIKCIKLYLTKHKSKHVPVDIEVSPALSESELNYMFNTFKKYHIYKKNDDEQSLLAKQEGFAYLNSKECSESFERRRMIEIDLIVFGNNSILSRIYKLFREEHDDRENAMLQKIYAYSRENQYNQAVFLIGAAHRNSIMQKINQSEMHSKSMIRWTFYENVY